MIWLQFHSVPSPRSAGRQADLLFKFNKYSLCSNPSVKWTVKVMKEKEQDVINWFDAEEKKKENELARARVHQQNARLLLLSANSKNVPFFFFWLTLVILDSLWIRNSH